MNLLKKLAISIWQSILIFWHCIMLCNWTFHWQFSNLKFIYIYKKKGWLYTDEFNKKSSAWTYTLNRLCYQRKNWFVFNKNGVASKAFSKCVRWCLKYCLNILIHKICESRLIQRFTRYCWAFSFFIWLIINHVYHSQWFMVLLSYSA